MNQTKSLPPIVQIGLVLLLLNGCSNPATVMPAITVAPPSYPTPLPPTSTSDLASDLPQSITLCPQAFSINSLKNDSQTSFPQPVIIAIQDLSSGNSNWNLLRLDRQLLKDKGYNQDVEQLITTSASKAKGLVCIQSSWKLVGHYGGDGHQVSNAYAIQWDVRVVRLNDGGVVAMPPDQLEGSPPASVREGEEGYGSDPEDEFLQWMISTASPHPELKQQIEEDKHKYWDLLSSLSPTNIRDLVVCKEPDPIDSTCKLINTSRPLIDFAKAIQTAQEYDPNRPDYIQEFYVALDLTTGELFEFEFQLKAMPDKTVYIYFIKREGRITNYIGQAQVAGSRLYEWLQSVGVLEKDG